MHPGKSRAIWRGFVHNACDRLWAFCIDLVRRPCAKVLRKDFELCKLVMARHARPSCAPVMQIAIAKGCHADCNRLRSNTTECAATSRGTAIFTKAGSHRAVGPMLTAGGLAIFSFCLRLIRFTGLCGFLAAFNDFNIVSQILLDFRKLFDEPE